jgi:dynein heavy chain
VICENIGEYIDPAINSIVCKEIYEVSGDKYIRFNDNQVEFNDNFKFFMISNLANPHFSPELQTRTRVLNFSITKEGLEQQLLSIVCRNESARDEDERDRIQR